MLCRSSSVWHRASGVSLQTPLLIPSFSSRGFAAFKRNGNGEVSQIAGILAATSEFIIETYLISAYDVYHGYIPAPRDLPYTPELVFLDSGGYEVSTGQDYSTVLASPPASDPWDRQKWESIILSWPDHIPLAAISYDHHLERLPFNDQVECARQDSSKVGQHLYAFLLKPETPSEMTLETTLRVAIANIGELGGFDIVGVTEKELGHSILDRMVSVARLRLAMDEAGIKAPIHIFGALDPLSVCFYYLSGAEIFDGLTWIRYGYHDGRCIYTHNLGAIKYGIHVRNDTVRSRALAENYYYLGHLQHRLREFRITHNFEKLEPHAGLLKDAWDSLQTRLGGRL